MTLCWFPVAPCSCVAVLSRRRESLTTMEMAPTSSSCGDRRTRMARKRTPVSPRTHRRSCVGFAQLSATANPEQTLRRREYSEDCGFELALGGTDTTLRL